MDILTRKGTTVIPFIYDDAHYFRKGMACKISKENMVCLNAKNEWLISPNYSEIKNWNDNWVLVNKNDKWAFMINQVNKGRIFVMIKLLWLPRVMTWFVLMA